MEYARPATAADIPVLRVLSEMALSELAGQRGEEEPVVPAPGRAADDQGHAADAEQAARWR